MGYLGETVTPRKYEHTVSNKPRARTWSETTSMGCYDDSRDVLKDTEPQKEFARRVDGRRENKLASASRLHTLCWIHKRVRGGGTVSHWTLPAQNPQL